MDLEMLSICKQFFSYLNSTNIRYCHWKSNSHLSEALNGKTDLDLLIHEQESKTFNDALRLFQFLPILSPPSKKFPFMYDYLGFDKMTGKLIHLHVHFKLIMGQRFIKNHHLPIEGIFFRYLTRYKNIYIPKAELELLILIIRALMKASMSDILRQIIYDVMKKNGTGFPKGIEEEFRNLIASTDPNKISVILEESGLPIKFDLISKFLIKFSSDKFKFYDFIFFNRLILNNLKSFRRDISWKKIIIYLSLLFKSQPIIKKFLPSKRKTLINKGVSIAIIGADGSGKTTLTKELEKWLSWKLSTRLYYYGIPKNRFNTCINLMIRLVNAIKLKKFERFLINLRWTIIAKYRANVSKRIKLDILKKRVVIIDRFPLKEFRDMKHPMDGPRLTKKNIRESSIFTRLEAKYYQLINEPDLIIALQAPIKVLRQRKTDLELELHEEKASAVNSLKTVGKIITIDASQPYFDVRLKIQTIIWEFILNKENSYG